MTEERSYLNREIDEKYNDIRETLSRIEVQTTKHNGRLTRLEKITWVVGTAITVLAVSGNSQALKLFASFF